MPTRVLVADDDRVNRVLLATVLRKAGYEVLEAADGQQALEVLQREAVSCVLLDLQMPVVDGATVVRTLRSDPEYAARREVPVVGVSGTSLTEGQLREAGMDRMLAKPFDAMEVCRLVDGFCRVAD